LDISKNHILLKIMTWDLPLSEIMNFGCHFCSIDRELMGYKKTFPERKVSTITGE